MIQIIEGHTQTITFPTSDAGTTAVVLSGNGTKAAGATADQFVLTPAAAFSVTQYKFTSAIATVNYQTLIELVSLSVAGDDPPHPNKELETPV